jgi:hypothetical protein
MSDVVSVVLFGVVLLVFAFLAWCWMWPRG